MKEIARVIAIYLPQYHPIPENDVWWGKGFTEWTNVAKAKPLYSGHYQPRVPADLGFYDLRLPEARQAQANLAASHGVYGFCYYHYWFAGRRILERPFNEVLTSGNPDFPFCLCWANETWRGIWHGCPDRVLIEQTYPGLDDYREHFNYLYKAFSDPRYITVDGKPLFFIYKPWDIKNIDQLLMFWNDQAKSKGLKGIHFVAMQAPKNNDVVSNYFDGYAISYKPDRKRWIDRKKMPVKWLIQGTINKINEKIKRPTIYDYATEMPKIVQYRDKGKYNYPVILPNWDNTPRCGAEGMVLHGSTPQLFEKNLIKAIDLVKDNSAENKIIVIKSWNEWAEGNYLEPDVVYGKEYLEVIRKNILI